jgi:hypothetical protein
MNPALYPQVRESAHYSCLLTCVAVLDNKSGRNVVSTDEPALTQTAFEERFMATIPTSAQNPSAQDYCDPLIAAARFVNEASALDRALAMRKALRPSRSAAARLGWERRK